MEAVQVGSAQTARHAIQLGVVPGNRERQRGVEQRTEVVRAVGELPEVIGIEKQVPSDGLLQTRIELVALARFDGHRIGAEDVLVQPAHSGGVGEKQILVERGFKGPGVGYAQYRSRLLDVISDT